MLALLLVAAILGDAVNYAVGHYIGPRIFTRQRPDAGWLHKLLNREHLAQAHAFFERYGGKAVVLGRFVPIVRTFVPFVAGAGAMTYAPSPFYNVVGAVLWVGVCVGAGYAVRQRADRARKLLAGRARHRLRVAAAGRRRVPEAPPRAWK